MEGLRKGEERKEEGANKRLKALFKNPGYVANVLFYYILIAKHFDNIFRQAISYLTVSRNRLGNFSIRVLIPIVTAAVTDEDTSHVLYFPDKLGALHPTISSPILRAWGILPVLRSR